VKRAHRPQLDYALHKHSRAVCLGEYSPKTNVWLGANWRFATFSMIELWTSCAGTFLNQRVQIAEVVCVVTIYRASNSATSGK